MARIALALVLAAGCGFRGRAAPADQEPDAAEELDAPAADAAPLCVSYAAFGTSKYRFIGAPQAAWAAAEADCADDEPGATHLVAIGSDAERGLVDDISNADVWVGLDDIAVDDTWLWIIGGQQANTRPPWKGGEPSNGPEDDCGMLDNSAELDAKNCDEMHAYVCECDGKPPRI